jgi:hypothetical protein
MRSTKGEAIPIKHRALLLRMATYLLLIVAVFFVWQQLGLLTPPSSPPRLPSTQLTDIQKTELSAYTQMNQLITTLSTGLLAGIGYILSSGKEIKGSPKRLRFSIAFGSASFAALSLFLGYFVYQMLIGELDDGVFNLDLPLVLYSSFGHFFSFLLAVALFAELTFQAFSTEDSDAQKSHSHSG